MKTGNNGGNKRGILNCLRNVEKLQPNAENQLPLQPTQKKSSENFQRSMPSHESKFLVIISRDTPFFQRGRIESSLAIIED